MGKIDIGITANNAGFKKAADETIDYMHRMSSEAKASGSEVSGMFKEVVKQTAAFAGLSLGAAGLKTFATSIVNVRKEMQSLHTSFSVLLGDQAKADAMFGELKDFAVSTPLMLKDLASGAQTMLGFNIEAEKVIPMLKAIGDISMGDAQKFQSLTLAFSQMSATGKLMGQDLLQMINAGFNPLTEISRKTGKSIAELKEEMSAGAISAEMVADAFMSATQKGGKFYGMLEKQGKTLKGQFNALQGAIDDMFNALGEKGEGTISATVGGITELVKNYEKVGQVLEALIITYGSYKAALLIVRAVEMSNAVGIGMTVKSLWASVAATKAATAAQAAFNAVAKANPYVLIITAVLAAATAVVAFAGSTDEAAKAQERLNKAQEDFADRQKKEAERAKELIGIIQDQSATDNQRMQAYDELGIRCSRLTDKYSMEQIAVMSLTNAYRELNRVQEQDKMEFLVDDTNRKVRVYNDLKRVQSGAQASASAETQAFIKDNGLAGLKLKDVMSMLKGQIDSQKDTVSQYLANSERKQESGMSYQQEARLVYDDWMEAKRTYERLVSSQTATKEEVKKARSEMERFDKEYEELTGSKASSKGRKSGSDNGNDKDRLQRIADLEEQISRERERMARSNELAIAQARIDGMALGSERNLEQIDLDYEKEKEKIRQQQEDLLRSREENARRLWEEKNEDSGASWTSSGAKKAFFDNGGGELTDEDRKYFEALREAAEKTHEQAVATQTQMDQEAMNDYLAKYGTFQQKRQAVTDKYNALIAKAENEGSVLALKKQMEEALSDIDTEAMKMDINWEAIFGDLGMYTKKQLQALRGQLEKYRKSDEYAKATVENKKVVDEALSQISETIADKGGIFGNIAEALQELADAETELADARDELEKASTDKEKEAARTKVNPAQSKKDKAEAKAKTAAEDARDSIASLANTITQLGSASEMSLTDVGNVASQIASSFGEMGEKVGGWIGAIFTLVDMIARDGIAGLIQNVGKVLGQALGGLFGKDIDASLHYYQDQKKIHDNYIKLLSEVISDQEELMKKQAGLDALDSYKKSESNYRDIQEARRKDLLNYLNAGSSSGFMGIGSSSSYGRQLYNEITSDFELAKQYADIFNLGSLSNINSRMKELAIATVEQIKALKECRELWVLLPDEVISYYNEILEAEDAIRDMQNALNETVAGTGFETLESNFASTLENMDSKASDFGDNLEGYFRKAIVNGLMKSKYDKMLQDWYGSAQDGTGFAGALGKGGENMTQSQIDELRNTYMEIVNQANSEADAIRDMLGIKPSDSSSSANATVGTASSMTEEQGNEICGRLTAIQLQGETRIAQGYQSIGLSQTANMILGSILDLDAARNAYLSDIYERMGLMQQQMAAGLEAIKNNTKNL